MVNRTKNVKVTKEQVEALGQKIWDICHMRYSQVVWHDARSAYGEVVLDQLSAIQEEQAEVFEDLIGELFDED